MAFSMFYRTKGTGATGQANDIWPRAGLVITQHVVFCYWAWNGLEAGLGDLMEFVLIDGICVN